MTFLLMLRACPIVQIIQICCRAVCNVKPLFSVVLVLLVFCLRSKVQLCAQKHTNQKHEGQHVAVQTLNMTL